MYFAKKVLITADEVVNLISISHRGSEALLGLLTSLGFTKYFDGRYQLTDVSRNFLPPESDYYWGSMLKLYQDPPIDHGMLLEALLKDGRSDGKRSTEEWAAGKLTRQ